MNTTLTPTTRQTTQPTHRAVETPRPERRMGVIDRAALHLGMALIRWGRRPGRELARYERRVTGHELGLLYRQQQLAAQELQREHALAMSLALIRIR